MKVLTESKSFITIRVEADDVRALADKWPCSGLNRDNGMLCEFDKRNGDLVDIDDAAMHPGADGAAVSALVDDAKAFAQLLVKW